MFHFIVQRMDLGECPNIHDVALRADYEAAVKSKDYYYDIDVSAAPEFGIFTSKDWSLINCHSNYIALLFDQSLEYGLIVIADK